MKRHTAKRLYVLIYLGLLGGLVPTASQAGVAITNETVREFQQNRQPHTARIITEDGTISRSGLVPSPTASNQSPRPEPATSFRLERTVGRTDTQVLATYIVDPVYAEISLNRSKSVLVEGVVDAIYVQPDGSSEIQMYDSRFDETIRCFLSPEFFRRLDSVAVGQKINVRGQILGRPGQDVLMTVDYLGLGRDRQESSQEAPRPVGRLVPPESWQEFAWFSGTAGS